MLHDQRMLRSWKRWRSEILSSPEQAFSEEKRFHTLYNMYTWLQTLEPSHGYYDVWNEAFVAKAFDVPT
jgi:hypothetical protein